jgi:hypothetical protein
VAGAAARAPHALVQEYLNRQEESLWAIVSNGRVLRILRDSSSLAGQSFLEFDLEAMFEGEVFSDFVALFMVAHQSRVEVAPDAPASDCWLEKWRTAAVSRARERWGSCGSGCGRRSRRSAPGSCTTRTTARWCTGSTAAS